jgi:LuxR family transcriptional regulator, maltose regulon positive regulatory protein
VGVPVLDSGAGGSNGASLAVPAVDGGGRRRTSGRGTPALVETKLRPPPPKRGAVARTTLVNRLRHAEAGLVSVVAPAGYGKTTLLAQWAAAETRPVAWLSLDVRDNDPQVLLAHAVGAIDRAVPGVLARNLAAPRAGRTSPVARTLRTLASFPDPILLVLDGADALQARESLALLAALVDHVPAASTVALGARVLPRLPLAALRARRGIEALGARDLAFSNREAQLLLDGSAELGKDERAALIDACEGWPAALSLAALSARDGSGSATAPAGFSGTDRYLADYVGSEAFARLRPADAEFLRRTAVLPELSAPLCDAVLRESGTKTTLARIARAGIFLFPVEGRPGWLRFHGLVRELLQRELAAVEPQLAQTLHRRAATRHGKHGELEAALEHADAAGDVARVIELVDALALPLSSDGRLATVESWLSRFDERMLARHPMLAAHACRVHALRGRAAEAERMLEVAERGARRGGRGATALRPKILVLRAALCRSGPRRMVADARAARARLSRASRWHAAALELEAFAGVLLGADDAADARLADAYRSAVSFGLRETQMVAVAQRSLLARARGDDGRADAFAAEALELARSEHLAAYPTRTIALAAAAGAALHHRRWGEARELLAATEPARPLLTEALPWLAVIARLELARGYLTLHDVDAAREALDEAAAVHAARPDLGVLGGRLHGLRAELDAATPQGAAERFGLTPAELRLLPLLATHLSFREIAEQLQVSRNTVKTQAISIYRRLGVSGRSEAILRVGSLERSDAAA